MRLAHRTNYIYVHTTPGGACVNRNLIAWTNFVYYSARKVCKLSRIVGK